MAAPIQGLWDRFREYAAGAYSKNPEHQSDIDGWFRAVYALSRTEDLQLSHGRFVHHDRPDLSFEVFGLGRMFFSTSPFVKTIPFPYQADAPQRHPEKRIGVHLRDYGRLDRAFENFRDAAFAQISGDPHRYVSYRNFVYPPEAPKSAYLLAMKSEICADHRAAAVAGLSPEELAATEIRFAKFSPRGAFEHQDFKVKEMEQSRFSRSHIYSFDRASTLYKISNRLWVPCPPHASASHYASFGKTDREEEKGPWHKAQTSRQGRTVLVTSEGFRPVTDVRNPWRLRLFPA